MLQNSMNYFNLKFFLVFVCCLLAVLRGGSLGLLGDDVDGEGDGGGGVGSYLLLLTPLVGSE